MRPSVERLVFVAFVLALGLLGMTAVATRRAHDAAMREARLTEDAASALRTVSSLRAAVLATESSARGFAATGDDAFLARIGQSRSQAVRELARLGNALDDPDERLLVRALGPIVDERLQRSELLITKRREGGQEAAVALIASRQGLELTDRIMGLCDGLDASIARRRMESEARATRHSLSSSRVALASVFVGILVTVLTLVILRARLVSARREREIANGIVQLVGASDEAIIGKTPDGIVLSWNAGAERLYGWSEREMVGESVTRIIPADRRAEIEAAVARVLTGESVPPFDTRRVRKDGTTVSISVSLAPVRSAEGQIVGIATVARDVTEALHADERRDELIDELKRAAARRRALEGMLSACAWCKAIRDDGGSWHPMERYLEQRAELQFTHGICPGCTARLKSEISEAK